MTSVAAAADAGAQPVARLPGVGPALQELLRKLGLERVQDLWFHLPLRYEDRTRVTAIADLRPGQGAQVVGTVEAVERGFRYRPQLKVALTDGSRQTLQLRFFHFNRAQAEQLAPGARLLCFGEVRHAAQGLEMVHPQYRRLAAGEDAVVEDRLSPVYPTSPGIAKSDVREVYPPSNPELSAVVAQQNQDKQAANPAPQQPAQPQQVAAQPAANPPRAETNGSASAEPAPAQHLAETRQARERIVVARRDEAARTLCAADQPLFDEQCDRLARRDAGYAERIR